MARGPEAAGALGRDGPPGLDGMLDEEGRPAPVPVLRIADIVSSFQHVRRGELDLDREAVNGEDEDDGVVVCQSVSIEPCSAAPC